MAREEGLAMTKFPWSRPKEFQDTEPASTLPVVPPGEEAGYAVTAPLPLGTVRAAASASAAPAEPTLADLLIEIRRNNRVCPQPIAWEAFYRLLGENAAGAPLPARPLVGRDWASTPALAKRMCLRAQVEWAAGHDCVNAAYRYLSKLPDAEWHYMG
jgi:hypothetical protein